MRPYLDTLVGAKTNFEWRASDPRKFAYQLREAIRVAKLYESQYPQYASLLDKFAFRILTDSKSNLPYGVLAQLKLNLDVQPVNLGKITIENAFSAMEVVGAAIQHKAPIIHFPNASLDESEVTKVKKWCEVGEYTCDIYHDNQGLLLTKK